MWLAGLLLLRRLQRRRFLPRNLVSCLVVVVDAPVGRHRRLPARLSWRWATSFAASVFLATSGAQRTQLGAVSLERGLCQPQFRGRRWRLCHSWRLGGGELRCRRDRLPVFEPIPPDERGGWQAHPQQFRCGHGVLRREVRAGVGLDIPHHACSLPKTAASAGPKMEATLQLCKKNSCPPSRVGTGLVTLY